MARKPTTFSKVSTGYNDSVNSVGESGYDLGFIDGYGTTLTLATGLTGAVTGNVTGNLTGNVTAETVAATTSVTIGQGGTAMTALSLTTHEVDFGSISGENNSLVTVGITGAAGDDALLVTRPSTWSGDAYNVLSIAAQSGDTAGEVNLIAFNSGTTDTNPAAGVVTVLRIAF